MQPAEQPRSSFFSPREEDGQWPDEGGIVLVIVNWLHKRSTLTCRCVRKNSFVRNGTATLELVLCMPVLLALIVGVVWLGTSVIAQTEVTIEARHKSWLKRNESTGTALLFLKDDVVSDEASQTVDVSPLFDGAESPESSHDVMSGAWDFEKLSFENTPSWKLYAIAAANTKTAAVQNGYVDAQNDFTQFKNQAGNIWNIIGAGLIQQLTGLGDTVKSALEGAENAGDGEKSREQDRINRDLNAKKTELEKARDALSNLDEDASDALRDVLRNRVERLKAEVDDLESDLEALE